MEKAYKQLFFLLLISFVIIVSCNSVNYMRIATFFQPIKDSESLDVTTVITVPDEAVSVKDILHRYQRGMIELPPMITGEDEDIDSTLSDFEDFVDAHDAINQVNINLKKASIKKASEEADTTVSQQSGEKVVSATEDAP